LISPVAWHKSRTIANRGGRQDLREKNPLCIVGREEEVERGERGVGFYHVTIRPANFFGISFYSAFIQQEYRAVT
jgi:hypothetical protein